MTWQDGLMLSCKDHVDDIGPKGMLTHKGSQGEGMVARITRYGRWVAMTGENLSFGQKTALDVMIQLIVDDGIADRGHRVAVFRPNHKMMGSYTGGHKSYGVMTCMNYAFNFIEGTPAQQEKWKKQIENLK